MADCCQLEIIKGKDYQPADFKRLQGGLEFERCSLEKDQKILCPKYWIAEGLRRMSCRDKFLLLLL